MITSMKVTDTNRDALAAIARDELGGATLDEALRILIFHHRCLVDIERLEADPAALKAYQDEAAAFAEVDIAVVG